jgi:hypothetical protein
LRDLFFLNFFKYNFDIVEEMIQKHHLYHHYSFYYFYIYQIV